MCHEKIAVWNFKGNMSCLVYSLSMVPPPPSIQLPVLLSVDTRVFRLQGFVLELETCQPSAFLPFTIVVILNDRIAFAKVREIYRV